VEVHRKLGADLEVDVPYQILRFVLKDDRELERVREEYGSGRMLSGEIKQYLFEVLREMMTELREKVEQYRDLVARNGITLVRNAEELREAVASMG